MGNMRRKEEIDEVYKKLSPRADELYEFVMQYDDYICQARDYGNGDSIKMVEAHTLTMIEEHPGITVSDLAKLWKRTKGTVSVNVKALEKKGYVFKQKENNNSKEVHLYVTEAGEELSTIHKLYDNIDIMQTQSELLKTCTLNEIDTFYKVIHEYLQLFIK